MLKRLFKNLIYFIVVIIISLILSIVISSQFLDVPVIDLTSEFCVYIKEHFNLKY